MAQSDVLNYLMKKREESDDWFKVCDIKEEMRKSGFSKSALKNIHENLYKLASFQIIEFKGVGMWEHYKIFRYKKE